jgi:hypothetical protein
MEGRRRTPLVELVILALVIIELVILALVIMVCRVKGSQSKVEERRRRTRGNVRCLCLPLSSLSSLSSQRFKRLWPSSSTWTMWVAWTARQENEKSQWRWRRGREGSGRKEERTVVVVGLDVDALVAELLVVELDVVLVATETVKEEDVLAVVFGRGN